MIRIVTDSNADLNQEQAKALGVSGVGYTYVSFGDKSYRTDQLGIEEFHGMMKTNPNFPKTSAPSIGDFKDIYDTLKGDEVISLHITRDLSGTIASAEAAAQMVDGDPKIAVVDTRSISAGEALFIKEARRLIDAGADVIVPTGGLPMMMFAEEAGAAIDGVPIVNGVTVLVKAAEMAVKLSRLTGHVASRAPHSGYVLPSAQALEEFLQHG